jgi:hypothetical protein
MKPIVKFLRFIMFLLYLVFASRYACPELILFTIARHVSHPAAALATIARVISDRTLHGLHRAEPAGEL